MSTKPGIRRLWSAVAATVCATWCVIWISTEDASAGVPQTRMADWNVAGAARGGGYSGWLLEGYPSGTNSTDPNLWSYIQGRGAAYPGIVTLQEVCRSQAELLQPYMASKGFGQFAMYDALTSTTACPDSNHTFGNVVWVYGPGQTAWASAPFAHQYATEKRGMTCVRSTFYGIHACSVHLIPTPNNEASYTTWRADCQLAEAMGPVYYTYQLGERVVLGGDLNIDSFNYPNISNAPSKWYNKCAEPYADTGPFWSYPTTIALNYQNFWESDQTSGSQYRPTAGSKKIDYIFILKGWGDFAADLFIWYQPDSDHNLLESYLRY